MSTIPSMDLSAMLNDEKDIFFSEEETVFASLQKETEGSDAQQEISGAGYIDDSTKMYMQDIGRFPLLSSEEELEIARRVAMGDEQARQKLINCNLVWSSRSPRSILLPVCLSSTSSKKVISA